MHGCEQNIPYCRVSFSFLSKRGQNERLYGLLGGGGGQTNICVQSMMQTRGSRGMPGGNFDFFRHNLVESGTVFAQT